MRTFVITLAGDDARRAPLLAALSAQGLDWELMLGVDGRRGLPAPLEAEVDRAAARTRSGAPMTDGELACALSHRAVYRRIVDEGLDAALVLEDDAIVHPRLGEFLAAWDPAVADLLLLDHSRAWGEKRPRFVSGAFAVHRLGLPYYNPSFATGYVLTRRGAERLLQACSPVRAVADWPVHLYDFGAMAVTPRLVDHQDPDTGHSNLRVERQAAGLLGAGKPKDAWWLKLRISLAKRLFAKSLSVSDRR
ncbi:glycosyltransferase family 25 protein [Rubrivivax benzoatilyticus]|uniref:Glycosyltransferase family 25 protein n=1 Tax=Rubrivivax benzoatilyticus TaxID=316997 RepID=A0ABX0HS19_9BURK|nr:glycosyltransferase family 25 protein [Rubrivivax benzoatilyticus]EGJ09766.1 glycosyl transferase family 25 [Rubrivivax benzoatilyticus JA2 = ATCC BAA-35]NHK97443.1 glycosyltransferase family 25 protein [Rubrivivax benzoatilyticus]NHL22862.1 glycosyltransferase family 25 protein [Rubrivivax benzoatilyticus]